MNRENLKSIARQLSAARYRLSNDHVRLNAFRLGALGAEDIAQAINAIDAASIMVSQLPKSERRQSGWGICSGTVLLPSTVRTTKTAAIAEFIEAYQASMKLQAGTSTAWRRMARANKLKWSNLVAVGYSVVKVEVSYQPPAQTPRRARR